MRALTSLPSLTLLFAIALTGCATDEGGIDDTSPGSGDGKADGAADPMAGYFHVYLQDADCSLSSVSRCGPAVRKLNRSSMRCVDGTVGPECGIFNVDYSRTGLTRDEIERYAQIQSIRVNPDVKFIVRGRLALQGDLYVLQASEVWVAGSAAGKSSGLFVLTQQNGTYCDSPTCIEFNEYELNSASKVAIADVRLADARPEPDQLLMAQDLLLYTRAGLIVVGNRYTVTDGAAQAAGRTANQYYLKAPIPLSW